MDHETLKWCEDKLNEECERMEKLGRSHPEDSPSRGRCFARCRTLHKMAMKFKYMRGAAKLEDVFRAS